MHSLHSRKDCIQNAFSAKTQNSPKTPEQILVRTKTKNQELRFPQDSWANLGSNQNQEPRTKIPPGLLSKSWFEPKPRTKNQDSPRTPEQILVRTKTKNQEPRFAQESWGNLGSWFGSNQDLLRSPGGILVLGSWFWFLVLRLKSKIPKRLDKECILNAFLQPRTKIPQRLLSKSWFLVLGFKSKIPQRLLSKSWFLALGFKSTIPQRLLSKS